jgi:3-carboxy-cis,cis-muconate cycloisomerase
MAVSPFCSTLTADLFGDEEVAARFSDAAEIAAMIRVEAALARAEGRLGIIPRDAADQISAALADVVVEPESLRAGFASAGVPVPDLVAALRKAVDAEAGAYVHWGATSQDIVDTGLVLRLGEVCDLLDARLGRLGDALADAAERYAELPMAARTRSQIATPTTFGLRVAGWLAPLTRCRARLKELRPRLLTAQLGGASGTLSVFEDKGLEIAAALAEELRLSRPVKPWHSERDSVAEFAGWLSLLTGAIGKMGGDLIILSRSEVGEVRAGAGGGSSTMPQKANTVGPEALVALARFNAGQIGLAHQALAHAEERDATAWSLEWMALPQMAVAAGAALRHAENLATSVRPDAARMRANLDLGGGGAMAEAASFALAAHMPRPEAQALVKQAARAAAETNGSLADTLPEIVKIELDWSTVLDPAHATGQAANLARATAAEWRAATGKEPKE